MLQRFIGSASRETAVMVERMVKLLVQNKVVLCISFFIQQAVNGITNRNRIVLLPEWIDVHIELPLGQLLANVFRKARPDANELIGVFDMKRGLIGLYYCAENVHAANKLKIGAVQASAFRTNV